MAIDTENPGVSGWPDPESEANAATDSLTPPPASGVEVEPEQSSDGRSGFVPQAGDLTRGWNFVTLVLWALVFLALAAVWGVSAQLGLATWWLGPRGDRNIALVRFLPFVAPIFMLLRTLLAMRWNAVYGVLAGLFIVVIGAFDFSHVSGLAWLEIIIGLAASAGSIASLAGTYRRARA